MNSKRFVLKQKESEVIEPVREMLLLVEKNNSTLPHKNIENKKERERK